MSWLLEEACPWGSELPLPLPASCAEEALLLVPCLEDEFFGLALAVELQLVPPLPAWHRDSPGRVA